MIITVLTCTHCGMHASPHKMSGEDVPLCKSPSTLHVTWWQRLIYFRLWPFWVFDMEVFYIYIWKLVTSMTHCYALWSIVVPKPFFPITIFNILAVLITRIRAHMRTNNWKCALKTLFNLWLNYTIYIWVYY